MGFWGTSLYANDTSQDVRDSYRRLLETNSNDVAYRMIREEYSELMGTEEEPLFWYALADTMWRVGRLTQEVQERTLAWIAAEGGLCFWEGKRENAWRKTLSGLERRLDQPQPREKKIISHEEIQYNPGQIGDVFAYRFHSKAAKEQGRDGKYILMQKIGVYNDIYPQMILFDGIYEEIPEKVELDALRILPYDNAEAYAAADRRYFPKLQVSAWFDLYFRRNTPARHMTCLGNYPVRFREGSPGAYGWDTHTFEDTTLYYYDLWQCYDYILGETDVVAERNQKPGKTICRLPGDQTEQKTSYNVGTSKTTGDCHTGLRTGLQCPIVGNTLQEVFIMKKNLTELVFILDRSGSMAGLEADTVGGFNSMLEKQQRQDGECLISTVLFDHESTVLHDRVDVRSVAPMTARDYTVRGCTALLDAIGGAIHHIGNVHKYARAEDVPERTLFVITTDGMENASRKYSAEKVKQMVKRQKEQYGWEFLFLGANIDAVETARHFGIGADRAVTYRSDSRGTRLNYQVVSEAICQVRGHAPLSADWKKPIEDDRQPGTGAPPRPGQGFPEKGLKGEK